MKKETAFEIIHKYKLIPGKISREILNAIINDKISSIENRIANYISKKELDSLQKQYQSKLKEFDNQILPRYLVFYYLIKEIYPEFVWHCENTKGSLHKTRISQSRVKNLRPSLLSLLLGRVNAESDTLLHRKYNCIHQLPNAIIRRLDNLFKKINLFYEPEEEMLEFVSLIRKGLQGERITVFVPLCPDYSFEYLSHSKFLVKFTFENLGNKVGIIASWILNTLKVLHDVLDECGISVEFKFAIADFEAFSEDNLKTLGITEDEFLQKVSESLFDFAKSCPVPGKMFCFTELCGKDDWMKQLTKIKNRFSTNDYGESKLTKKKLLEIVAKRKELYARWYGVKNSLEDYINVALDQGAAYAAMGSILNEKYNNLLIFAADNKVMRPFYKVNKSIATLYLNKNYS